MRPVRWLALAAMLVVPPACSSLIGEQDVPAPVDAATDGWGAGDVVGAADAGGVDAGPCTKGTLRCEGLQVQECDTSGSWANIGSACPFVCASGECTGVCSPGAVACNGNQPQACETMGNWQSAGAPCA